MMGRGSGRYGSGCGTRWRLMASRETPAPPTTASPTSTAPPPQPTRWEGLKYF
uniref:Uncharacterized protein n=1 Tax=Setaria italica TaxID=4555 RepID=K3YFL9_SETIT